MNHKNALDSYQLSENPANDVRAFYTEMLRIRLERIQGENLKGQDGRLQGNNLVVFRRLELLDQNAARPIHRMPVRVDHVRIAESLGSEISAKIADTKKHQQEAITKLKELTAQENKITLGYKDFVLANDEKAIQQAEKDAVTIVGERRRYEIRRDGYGDATSRLEQDLDIYEKIAKACRWSLLRQQALVAITEYKAAVEKFAPVFNRCAAHLELSENVLYQDECLGMPMIDYLKKATCLPTKAFERNAEFDELKRSILEGIEANIHA